jgi:chromosome segregation protein
VNLAAVEELAQAAERKRFLDSQNADLQEAIATLEDAISRIDRESRDLLQDTFDRVNAISRSCSRSCSAAARPGWS